MGYEALPRVSDERTTLLAFLAWQRETLESKCAGLEPAQLRQRSAPPSSLSLLGLVRHLADVERGWLRRTLGGDPCDGIFAKLADPEADFRDIDDADVDAAFTAWRAERAHGDEVIIAHQLDDVVTQRSGREVSMRWILTHLIEEYSRHNGHADLLRERIDGAIGY